MSFSNDCASLNFYKQSSKGIYQDYIISFNEDQTTIPDVLDKTQDLFEQLIDTFSFYPLKARLVAKVCFIHVDKDTQETEERFYHFSSYQTEEVYDPEKFYERHMLKIASRLDKFNEHGSNLLIKNIQHVHICISHMRPFMQRS